MALAQVGYNDACGTPIHPVCQVSWLTPMPVRTDPRTEFRQRTASEAARKNKALQVLRTEVDTGTRRTSSPLLSNLIFGTVLLRPFRAAIRIFPRAGCLPAVTCGTRSRADRVRLQ